jgi:iron-regulated transporter 1
VRVGAAVVGGWTLLTIVPEYMLASALYRSYPQLTTKKKKTSQSADTPTNEENAETGTISRHLGGWKVYVDSSVCIPSISFSFLFLTVLDGGTLMTAYLLWVGLEEWVLGATRGTGAVFGLLGTFAFPFLKR